MCEAAHTGHHHVEYGQLIVARQGAVHRARAVGLGIQRKPLARQVLPDELAELRVVVDEQNTDEPALDVRMGRNHVIHFDTLWRRAATRRPAPTPGW